MLAVLSSLNMGIYPGYVLFSCGFDFDELIKLLKNKRDAKDYWFGIKDDKNLIDNGNYFALKRSIKRSDKEVETLLYYIIIKSEFTFTDYEYAKLAHEVLHIVQFHLPGILDRNREWESEAYLHTHLMLQCLKVLRGKNK